MNFYIHTFITLLVDGHTLLKIFADIVHQVEERGKLQQTSLIFPRLIPLQFYELLYKDENRSVIALFRLAL